MHEYPELETAVQKKAVGEVCPNGVL